MLAVRVVSVVATLVAVSFSSMGVAGAAPAPAPDACALLTIAEVESTFGVVPSTHPSVNALPSDFEHRSSCDWTGEWRANPDRNGIARATVDITSLTKKARKSNLAGLKKELGDKKSGTTKVGGLGDLAGFTEGEGGSPAQLRVIEGNLLIFFSGGTTSYDLEDTSATEDQLVALAELALGRL